MAAMGKLSVHVREEKAKMKEVYAISEKIWNAIIYDKVEQLEKYVHKEAVFVHMGVTLKRDNEIAIMKGAFLL